MGEFSVPSFALGARVQNPKELGKEWGRGRRETSRSSGEFFEISEKKRVKGSGVEGAKVGGKNRGRFRVYANG
jgi:hypothetical protein